ncbi:MAG: DUF47 family protein [Candidatus Heimdallarchaeota archaeon]|nr:DUF47 family protein [Candidatus Heimdallarchaeota archaeon]
MSLNTYLTDRKHRKIHELMLEHAGRCRAVGKSFMEASVMITTGKNNDLASRVSIIRAEERSADEVEAKINIEVAKSNLPTKLAEELLTFVRVLDRAAGASKRAVINLELISDYQLPNQYAKMVEESASIIRDIFIEMENALKRLDDTAYVKKSTQKVNQLETKIDNIYIELKKGYFEIEKAFNSSAALIILDHGFRDLEAAADFGEDAADLLLTLISRRG